MARWLLQGASLCLMACACGSSPPTEPSLPTVAGSYNLSLTHCWLSESQVLEDNFPPLEIFDFGASSGTPWWTLSQVGGDVSGTTSGSFPPFNWSGSLTARVVSPTKIEIMTLNYRDSSSHGGIHTFSAAGNGVVGVAGDIGGTLAGDYTDTPTFGGFTESPNACHWTQMPFRLIRR